VPDDAVLERTRAFDPAILSAREARRFVRAILREAGREGWAEAAELAVSEVVTNVVLHAHTPFDLTVRLLEDHARVEVRDRNPALPTQRDYDTQATTGRGMALVDAVTDAHGITALGAEGKVVWFCVGTPAEDASPEDLLHAWGADADGWQVEEAAAVTAARAETPVVLVRLERMPPTLWLAVRQHHDALLRDLALHRLQHPDCGIGEDDLAQADAARTTIDAALDGAVAGAKLRGDDRSRLPQGHPAPLPPVPTGLTLTVPVPAEGSSAYATLQDVLDVGERLALQEHFLARPGLPEVIAVRDWACEQVIRQLAGGSPSPWRGADDDAFAEQAHDGGAPLETGWDSSVVTDADRGAVAADDANRIVAVSRPLADALGHAPEDLVGRRVVTLVPKRFREAHVAGFTRHLSTGEAHVLGVPLDLPVLRRDGTEVACDVVIEQTGTTSGRRVYLAWVSPRG
jgi:PAS domain S-box-containing protein